MKTSTEEMDQVITTVRNEVGQLSGETQDP